MQGKSVGAIVRDHEGKFLVQYRLKQPIGIALPAGHVEDHETPEDALRRELFEETGLRVREAKEVYHAVIPTACGKGHQSHEWWVYEVTADGVPELKELEKHKFMRFMTREEMQPFLDRGECDPAWFKYILPSLGIL